jgi:SdrD B-like protein
MARPRLWSVASAWISVLGLAAVAVAEPSRSIDLPVAVPVEVVLSGVDQVISADPAVVRVDVDASRETIIFTGVALARQTVVYAWTPSGVTVFIAKVVAPAEATQSPRSVILSRDGSASLYRLVIGGGVRRTQDGFSRLPMTFGAMGSKAINGSSISFRGETRPFTDQAQQDPFGTAAVEWNGDRYHAALGDQPVDLAPQLGQVFALRGITATGSLGPVTATLFGGARATPAFRLVPYDNDPLPSLLGGTKLVWTPRADLKLSGTFAATEKSPIASLAAEWTSRGWLAGFETAATDNRLAAALRLRREIDAVTVDHRFVFRTPGVSALLSGGDGLTSDTSLSWALSKEVTALAHLALMPTLGLDGLKGSWYLGGRWAARPGMLLGLGVDRALDGSATSVGGSVDIQSKRFGNVSMTATRTLQQGTAGATEMWQQSLRAEKDVTLGPVSKVFVEETLMHGDLQGSLAVYAGAELEKGWIKASVAPGLIVPTVTDPNGVAEVLRLRITATPSAAFQVYADARQTFGARPDTTVQFGVGVGVGTGAWDSVASWFATESLDGVVFIDRNGNGVQDPDEPGLPGVKIQLDATHSVVTDASGRYRFSGLKRGGYTIAIDRASTPPDLRLASASPVKVDLPGGPRQISFAFAGAGAIHGIVFNDVHFSGQFSGIEPGVPAEVVIEGPGGRRTVSVNGVFSVGGLAPGRYRLTIDALSLPPAFVLDATDVEVELKPGDVASARFPVIALRAVQVTACRAPRGGDGCGGGEPPVSGLKVAVGSSVFRTDAQGRALLRQLPAGKLTISIDPSSVPAGWAVATPVALDLPETPVTLPLAIRLVPTGK